jgi:hypothetical protein
MASVRGSFRRRHASDRTRDLRDLDGVRQRRAVQVAFVIDEDLGLVDQAAKGVGMDDAIAVALKLAAEFRLRLRKAPAARLLLVSGVRREAIAACDDVIHAQGPKYS